ncbi:MAG: hypothetical protein QME58_10865 [Bacteroidota bacterium]|nr:hypothetical protein [Bacteroidota bacterium]
MAKETNELFSAGNLAKLLQVSPAVLKKAIEASKVKPDAKKGVCSYYSASTAEKIKKHLKK